MDKLQKPESRYPIYFENGVEVGFTSEKPDLTDPELFAKATLSHPVTIEKGKTLMEYNISPRLFGDVGVCNHHLCILCKVMKETEHDFIRHLAEAATDPD